MTKRVFVLNGLAILAVVCNHAAWWGIIAMFWWTDRYRPVTTPNYDQYGTVPYYGLMAVVRLAFFAVPAFLFVSGFFVAYASRGARLAPTWKVVKVRIANLLVPYLIWSIVCFIGDALQGTTYAPLEYLERLALGHADRSYFFIPLLCQFYLLSPLLVSVAKTRGRLLLFLSALLQLGATSLRYLELFGVETHALDLMIRLTPGWSFLPWAFFFTFGLVAGFHVGQLKRWLARFKWPVLLAGILLWLMTMLEAEMVSRITGQRWESPLNLPSSPYALAFILCFLGFEEVSIPFSKGLHQLARRSYGVYLLHNRTMEFVARAIRQIMPWMLAHQTTLFTPVLIVLALGGPLLFMAAVSKSPARRSYRYLFG